MQVFVRKADLSQQTVPVVAGLPDAPVIDRNAYGTDTTVISLPAGSVVNQSGAPVLVANWRNNADMITREEAYRRIIESFSEFMQRNAGLVMTNNILAYGADHTTWPPEEQTRYTTWQSGLDYIQQVRTRSDQLEAALPVDPTDDVNWPARIPPVYI